MKYLFLFLFASSMLALPTVLNAQCPSGDVTLNSQADVDNFAVNYPNCSQITGFLTISGNDITDLSPLANLQSVTESLDITFNDALTSLQGLNNLSSVGGDLSIESNDALASLQELNNLSSVGGSLSIRFSPALTSLQGLDNISSVSGDLSIESNDVLASLQGLDNISSVGGDLSIEFNDVLASLQELNNLTSVGGGLNIRFSPALTSLQGLDNLSSVEWSLRIENNAALTSLQGLGNLSSVGNDLRIVNNDALTSLQGLNNLSSLGLSLRIENNAALTSLQGLDNLSSVGNDFQIGNNDALTSLQGPNNLSSVEGYLQIENNDALTSLQGLNNTSLVGLYLRIENNAALTSLQGLDNLSSVGSDVQIFNNAALTSLQGLNNISSVGFSLQIENNAALTSLQGLDNLSSVGFSLDIIDNAALTSLQGLNNISSVGFSLYITDNAALTSLQELNNLSSVGGELIITDNPSLSTCSIDWICDNINNPAQTIVISNNATGCNSEAEVEMDCLPSETVVNSTADNLTAGDGNCTLREAIRNVNAGFDLSGGDCGIANTITFDPAINGTPIVLNLTGAGEDAAATGDLDINTGITIIGNGPANTIIDGNATDRIFEIIVNGETISLSGLTVRNGAVVGFGNFGGGLSSNSSSTFIISNCVFSGNVAYGGGAIYLQNSMSVDIDNCLFSSNEAENTNGGALFMNNGNFTIKNSFFQSNVANQTGGAIEANTGSYIIENSTFTGNTSGISGSAFYKSNSNGSIDLTNCTITENVSGSGAAAVLINNGSSGITHLTNNIIINNTGLADLIVTSNPPQVNSKNIVESCQGSCPTFFSTSDDVICGLSTCANGLGYYPVIPNSDADGTADTSTPLAGDICGNSRSASSYNIGSSEVFFTDNENPVAICPATQTVSNDAGECGANVSFTVPDPTDNCSATSSVSPASGSFFNVGTTQVTVTATDGTGNTSQCTFDVVVNDTENPTISCPADVTQTVDAGQTYATVIDIAPASSDDNCASPTITHTISGATTGSGGPDASGTQFNIGSSVVTYIIEDASNNTASCSFNVNVNGNAEIDVQDPNMNSLTSTISNYDFGNVNIMGGSASGTFTINNIGDIALLLDGSPTIDISGSASFSVIQPSSTTVAPAGATTFQIDYNPANEDCSQQTATVSIDNNDPDENPFVFTVSATPVDNVNPTANCPANITQDNDAGQCGANVSFDIPSPDDNCPGASATASPASGSFFDVGTTSVTVNATDASGNTSICTFEVVVNDTEAPTITCLADITVENDLGLCSAVVNIPAPTVADNCPGATFEYAPASGSAFDVGTTAVTATATDEDGNTSSCSFNVTVEDTEGPAINCPADITVAATSGAGTVVDYLAPEGTDNCTPTTMQTAGLASGDTFPIGTTTNTFEVTDGDGNSSSCSFDVTVDDVALDINCPADITVSNDAGDCSAVVTFEATETTGIPPSTITYSQDPGTAFPVGMTTVTATATNSEGSDQCSFTVTVTDDEAPTITCPADITVENDLGLCSAVVNIPAPTVADNCPGATFEYAPASGSAFDVGTTTVTATATDEDGNTASCTLNVTVNDTEAPNMICKKSTVDIELGQTLLSEQVDSMSTDNCAITELSVAPNVFGCGSLGLNTVTLTAQDAAGNSNTCTATVNVIDNNPPTAVCSNPTVNLTGDGITTVAASFFDGGSSAVCGGLDFSASMTAFDCDDVGETYTVTLTVTSQSSGLSDQCTSTVTVDDPNSFCCAPPMAVCENITVQLDASGNASITPADIGSSSTAECGLQSELLSVAEFGCLDVGAAMTVTYTITDINDDNDNCTANVTVEDNVAPTAICQNLAVQLDADGSGSITAQDIDNGSSDACGIHSLSLSQTEFGCGDVDANTLTLTVTDNNGNVGNCNAIVTVVDNTAPQARCKDITVQLGDNGQGSITADDIDNNSSDACGIQSLSLSQTEFGCGDVDANTVTLTATDNNGNAGNCDAIVTVVDNTAPQARCKDITVELGDNGQGSITADDIDDNSSDACGIQSLSLSQTEFGCGDVDANTVTLTATDNNGNAGNCDAIVTVVDNTAPLARCKDITVELGDNGQGSITADDIDD
ncbi:MAG: HYR domain-containing protein, partial [Bacteroidetes bacterium]|nr:HYR domain-containing protein [Bacteroidota bacterium]